MTDSPTDVPPEVIAHAERLARELLQKLRAEHGAGGPFDTPPEAPGHQAGGALVVRPLEAPDAQ